MCPGVCLTYLIVCLLWQVGQNLIHVAQQVSESQANVLPGEGERGVVRGRRREVWSEERGVLLAAATLHAHNMR